MTRTTFFILFFNSLVCLWLESQLPIDRGFDFISLAIRFAPFGLAALLGLVGKVSQKLNFVVSLVLTLFSYLIELIHPSEWANHLALYSGVVCAHLWFLEVAKSKTPEDSSRSLLHGYSLLLFLAFCFYLTVRLGLWEGLYIDRDIARGLFVFIFLTLPILLYALKLRGRGASLFDLCLMYLCISLLSSHLFLKARFELTSDFTAPYISWVYISLFIIHLIVAFALLRPLFPSSLWSFKPLRIAVSVICAVVTLKMIVLFVINLHIELNYAPQNRTQGIFEKHSTHLKAPLAELPVPSGSENTQRIRVLNVNVWGVEGWIPKFILSVTKDLSARMALLPGALASYNPDVIIIQEIWSDQRKLQFIRDFKKLGFKYFAKGSDSPMAKLGVGNGLLIISRLPLDEKIQMMTFSMDTRVDESFLFARKGVIKTRVNIRGTRWIDLYNSHLGGYGTKVENGRPVEFIQEEQALKLQQTLELGDFIKKTRTSSEMILGMDLNTHPFKFHQGRYQEDETSPEYQYLTCEGEGTKDCLGYQDPVFVLHPQEHGRMYTYNTLSNYYAHAGHFSVEPPGRLDYIFTTGGLKPLKSKIILTETELSDHYGLLVDFEIP